VDSLAPATARIRFSTVVEILNDKISLEKDGATRYHRILIYLSRKEGNKADELIEKFKIAIARGSECYIVIHDPLGNINAVDVATEFTPLIEASNNIPDCSAEYFWIGGNLMYFNRLKIQIRQADIARFGLLALLWTLPQALFEIPVLLASHLYLRTKLLTMNSVKHSSSMVIRLRPRNNRDQD
jgi:hypothetical protein